MFNIRFIIVAKSLENDYLAAEDDIKNMQRNKVDLVKQLYQLREHELDLQKCAGSSVSSENVVFVTPDSLTHQVSNENAKICKTILYLIRPLIHNEEFDHDSDTASYVVIFSLIFFNKIIILLLFLE